ncbi:hypothetical protein DL96DRAFT_1638385, partial [Flagelloscypha sp. PMI_526]
MPSATPIRCEPPKDIWEIVFHEFSTDELWAVRAISRATYALAAQAFYGTLWIRPNETKRLRGILSRIRENRFRISGLLHTIHLYSDISHEEPELFRVTAKLLDKTLSKPSLDVKHVTIHCVAGVQPYTIRILSSFAHSLVSLELQFVDLLVCDLFRSLPADLCCPKLESFTLIYGTGSGRYQGPPLFHSVTMISVGNKTKVQDVYTSELEGVFDRLRTLLPTTLTSLALHRLADRDFYHEIDPLFLFPGAYPDLKTLFLSGITLKREPSLQRFLDERVHSLEKLSVEGISLPYNTTTFSQIFLRLLRSANLTDLYMSWEVFSSFASLLKPNILIQRCPRLRRLDINFQFSSIYTYRETEFSLLVEIAKTGCRLEELNIYGGRLDMNLLMMALFTLHKTRMSLYGPSFDPKISEVSVNPGLWTQSFRELGVYRFCNLDQARTRVGPSAAHGVKKLLLQNILDYRFQTNEVKEKLDAVVTQAFGIAENDPPNITNPADMYDGLVVHLAEECLEQPDWVSVRVWMERCQAREAWEAKKKH